MTPSDVLTTGQRETILAALGVFRPAAVYLFGSAATGRLRNDSDLDVAFLPSERTDPKARFDVSQELAEVLRREIDLVDLLSASTVMAKEVIRTGVVLVDDGTSRRQEFEMRTLSDYARLNEERQPVLDVFK